MASLNSPSAKFNRADQHFDTLNRELSGLSDIKSYGITKDIDSRTGEQIYRFGKVPPMPDGLDLLIGEILYNFRCSLDHLIWQLVLSEGNNPTTRNEFPIFNNAPEYEANKGSRLKGVSDAVVTIVDSLQPCNSTGVDDYWWWLWYLQVLSNTDKHRHLLVTRRSLSKRVRVSGSDPKLTGVTGIYLAVPVEDGAVFFRTKANVDMEVNPKINVVFSNASSDIRKDLPILNIFSLIKGSVVEVFNRLGSHVK
jgi:hypothetical protein